MLAISRVLFTTATGLTCPLENAHLCVTSNRNIIQAGRSLQYTFYRALRDNRDHTHFCTDGPFCTLFTERLALVTQRSYTFLYGWSLLYTFYGALGACNIQIIHISVQTSLQSPYGRKRSRLRLIVKEREPDLQ